MSLVYDADIHPTFRAILPGFVRRGLLAALQAWHSDRRAPDVDIGPGYMHRWWVVPRNRFLNVYLHKVMRSDDDRALHDHPWACLSLILSGEYREVLPGGVVHRDEGSIIPRRAFAAHRLEVYPGRPVWTLFITGRKSREWGFHCPRGWIHWTKFTTADGVSTGKGCSDV